MTTFKNFIGQHTDRFALTYPGWRAELYFDYRSGGISDGHYKDDQYTMTSDEINGHSITISLPWAVNAQKLHAYVDRHADLFQQVLDGYTETDRGGKLDEKAQTALACVLQAMMQETFCPITGGRMTAADYFNGDAPDGLSLEMTKEELEALAERLKSDALSECDVLLDGVTEYITEHVDKLREVEQRSIAARMLGKKGGSAKTEAKAAAVRENGKKGGRPKGPGYRAKVDLSFVENSAPGARYHDIREFPALNNLAVGEVLNADLGFGKKYDDSGLYFPLYIDGKRVRDEGNRVYVRLFDIEKIEKKTEIRAAAWPTLLYEGGYVCEKCVNDPPTNVNGRSTLPKLGEKEENHLWCYSCASCGQYPVSKKSPMTEDEFMQGALKAIYLQD